MPERDHQLLHGLAVALAAATFGGAIGWALLFVGVGVWGLAIGAIVVVVVAVALGWDSGKRPLHLSLELFVGSSKYSCCTQPLGHSPGDSSPRPDRTPVVGMVACAY